MRTIRVTGKGQIRLRPDTTRIRLKIGDVLPQYGEAVRQSAEDTERLKDLLTGYGFQRSDLKTLDFGVDPEYESRKEKGAYVQRLVGYRYRHTMKIEFPSDNERLGRILFALAGSPVRPEFQISYTLKDPEAAKNELLAKAVSDARQKAALLADAAGVALKDVQSVDYSWGQIDFEIHPLREMKMMSAEPICDAFAMDIEPEDIEAEDSVTVIWEIG